MYYLHNGISLLPRGFPEFPVSYRFGDQQPTLQETSAPGLGDVEINDTGRNWGANTQNINLTFTEAVTIDATGWSITVNGVGKSVSYVSGSGSASVVFQINTVVHDGDLVRISYDQATGGTVSVTGSVEVKQLTGVEITESLSRRVRFTLSDKNNAAVANELVKAALLEYHGGVVADSITQSDSPIANWMTRANVASVTTDGAALFDMEYKGPARGGAPVYIAVIRAVESMIVATTVV
jgi:hypothetical protein